MILIISTLQVTNISSAVTEILKMQLIQNKLSVKHYVLNCKTHPR